MKQYKLIKKYPGLDTRINIGDIAKTELGWGCYGVNSMRFGGWNEAYFEGFDEFWEEVNQTNFEIIAYIEKKSSRIFSKENIKPMIAKYNYNIINIDYACMDGGWIDLQQGLPIGLIFFQ